MSEAPERILVESECGHANAYNSEDRRTWLHFPDNAQGYFYAEYVRADRIEELEARLSESEALLAKAVECVTWCAIYEESEVARTTLAELTSSEAANGEAKGGKDE